MIKRVSLLSLAVLLSSRFVAAADPPPGQLSPEAMQELFLKLSQPGPQHERFKSMVGRWDCECRNYDGNPDQPQRWKAQSEFKLILGGRYLQQEFSGEMPGAGKYSGQGLSGYDNAQQKYIGTWVDSMGTGILHTTGTYDAATKSTTETGAANSHLGEMKFKMVTQDVSADEFRFTMFMVTDSGEQKMMEIDYRRRKP